MPSLTLDREQILGHRRRANGLDERLPMSPAALRRAAWAGQQDSMPRAALLSIHARVADTQPGTLFDPALVQVWGPRYTAYVVPAPDMALFTLGRLPDDARARARAEQTAERLEDFLAGRGMSYDAAGAELGVNSNSLRYAAPTGRVLIRWEGARSPLVWCVPRPQMAPRAARDELARRFLNVFGPATAAGFSKWAGIAGREAAAAFERLRPDLLEVTTPLGTASILAADEDSFRSLPSPAAPARLLPSGDAYYLLWGAERELLVPDARLRGGLWTSRVWPGALLVGGEIVGTWRRDGHRLDVETWCDLSVAERQAVESEARALPLPGVARDIDLSWSRV